MVELSTTVDRNLDRQGFTGLDREAKARYAGPLRFTPTVGTVLILVGLILQSPSWLAAMALIALSGAAFPKGMIIDQVYNLAVRHLVHAPPLPATPQPRRFSYLLSTAALAGSALSFAVGHPVLGFVLGAAVATGGAIPATTLWCLGSWIFTALTRRLSGVLS